MMLLNNIIFLIIGGCLSSIYHLVKIEDLEEELYYERIKSKNLELELKKEKNFNRTTKFIRNSRVD